MATRIQLHPRLTAPEAGTPQTATQQLETQQLGTQQLGTQQLGTQQLGTQRRETQRRGTRQPQAPWRVRQVAPGTLSWWLGACLAGSGCVPGSIGGDGGTRASEGGAPHADAAGSIPADDASSPLADAGVAPQHPDGGALPGGEGGPTGDETCGDDDPLTHAGWVGFCGDRVDDNCQIDQPAEPCPEGPSAHNYCRTGDEPCPATAPASAAPAWNCEGSPPAGVIAWSRYANAANLNVSAFCVFVYESAAIPGEHYVAVQVTNGSNVRAAQPDAPGRDCMADTAARRHLYFSDLDDGDCPDVKYIHAYPSRADGYLGYPVDEQKLSNQCRKMIRNISYNDIAFDPDIQYFAASRSEAEAKLDILDTVEVSCIGIDNLSHEPYRPTEQFYVQAQAPLVRVP